MRAEVEVAPVDVTIGLAADSPVPSLVEPSLGSTTVGPRGFLSLLENRLGVAMTDVPFTTRLIQYLACVDEIDNEKAFYHASYMADPFSVARTLLQWRDQWYLAGWNGSFEGKVSTRLADMASIEALACDAVEPNVGQRIQRVISLLAHNPVGLGAIQLLDSLDNFPYLWRRLIESVDASITEPVEIEPQGNPGSDLRRLQDHLCSNSTEKVLLEGDGSVVVLRADTPLESSVLTALLIQQQLSHMPNRALSVLAESRGDLLDDALESIGDPRLGFRSLSTWRPIFQVLPLAIDLLWEPLNPKALFQFLSHSVGPIPARLRNELANTVAEVPGIGSEAWEDAIKRSLEKEKEETRSDYEQEIRYWLESARYDPQTGVDCATLSQRAQRVANWLLGAREASGDPDMHSLYSIALNQAQEFVNAAARLEAHGRGVLTRDNVQRLIDDVRGTGAPVADRKAEVCCDQNRAMPTSQAGSLYYPIDQLVWWDCQACDQVRRWPWSQSERAALAGQRVMLQSEDEQLDWLGRAWLRPILNSHEGVTLVLHNDVDRYHPVWDQINSLAEGLPNYSATDSEAIKSLGLGLKQVEARNLPRKKRWWLLPEEVSVPKREVESFSSLDSFINSPYQWLLRYGARIRPGSLATVNDGPLLKGNIAHRLFENYFISNPDIQAICLKQIPDWVDEHMITLLKAEGASLLEPGRQAECEEFITLVSASLQALAEHLQQAGVIKVNMEMWQEGLFTGGNLNGSIDMLATTADGCEAVVDIKWGGMRYRRDTLISGSYLQLATYAQLRLASGASSYPMLSYFIVSDAHMLNVDHDYFPNAERIVPETQENQAEYWARFEQTWRWRKEQFDQGRIEVTIGETEPTAESQPGENGLVLPETSDKFNDYKVLTGWEGNS